MKKILITLTVLSIISFFTFASIYNVQQDVQRASKQEQKEIIKQSYTVKEVHSKYIVAESNKNKNELINFYYADQTKIQTFNVNDKVVAYFKPYKNSYQIVDFKKAHSEKLTTYDYVITGKDNQGYYGKSLNDDTNIFLVQSNLPDGMELNENDHIRVSFPNEQWDVITKIEKLKGVN
jgi:hypothetical protein